MTLGNWNAYLHRKVHLIACGGTAMTLLDIKESTKDIDFIVPVEREHAYLVKALKSLGYKERSGSGFTKDGVYIFDLFKGGKVHTTNLIESPLMEGNNIPIQEFSMIYLGVLNYYDIIITKIFRSADVDIDDCTLLYEKKKSEINIDHLKTRYLETAQYDVAEDKLIKNLEHFINVLDE